MRLIAMSVSASIMICIIWTVRKLTFYKIPKTRFVWLWRLVLLRLFFPFYLPIPRLIQFPIQVGAPKHQIGHMGMVPLFIWIVGAVLLASFFLRTHWKACKTYSSATPIVDFDGKDWGIRLLRKPTFWKCELLSTPATYCVLKPKILLSDLDNVNNNESLNFAIIHELFHVKRFDVLTKWLLAFALSIYWFNPFVWVLYICFNRDMEFACDECVIRHLGDQKKASYARTLVSLAAENPDYGCFHTSFGNNLTEKRILSIVKGQGCTRKKYCLLCFILLLLFTIGFLTLTKSPKSKSLSQTSLIHVETSENYRSPPEGVKEESDSDNNVDKDYSVVYVF